MAGRSSPAAVRRGGGRPGGACALPLDLVRMQFLGDEDLPAPLLPRRGPGLLGGVAGRGEEVREEESARAGLRRNLSGLAGGEVADLNGAALLPRREGVLTEEQGGTVGQGGPHRGGAGG